MQHFRSPIGWILAALHQPLGLQQINEPDQGRSFYADFFPQLALPQAFSSAQEDNQRNCGRLRQAVRSERLIRFPTPQPSDPRDQEADFSMDGDLGWGHAKLDSILISRLQLYRIELIYESEQATMGGCVTKSWPGPKVPLVTRGVMTNRNDRSGGRYARMLELIPTFIVVAVDA